MSARRLPARRHPTTTARRVLSDNTRTAGGAFNWRSSLNAKCPAWVVFCQAYRLPRAALWTHKSTLESLGIRETRTIPIARSRSAALRGTDGPPARDERATAMPGPFSGKL